MVSNISIPSNKPGVIVPTKLVSRTVNPKAPVEPSFFLQLGNSNISNQDDIYIDNTTSCALKQSEIPNWQNTSYELFDIYYPQNYLNLGSLLNNQWGGESGEYGLNVISVDYNNDGYMDIYGFTTGDHYKEMGISERDILLINQNGTSFKTINVKESRKDAGNHGGFAIDINNDGWIDIVPLDEKHNTGSFTLKNIEEITNVH